MENEELYSNVIILFMYEETKIPAMKDLSTDIE